MHALVGCSDDPETRSLVAERVQNAAHATSDALRADTFSPPDTDAPDTTVAETTPADTGPTDTSQPPDTTVADTRDTADSAGTGETITGGPELVVPARVAIPWVAAGGGPSGLSLTLENRGSAGEFSATLSGDPALDLDPYDDVANASASMHLRFDGSTSPGVFSATLTIRDHAATHHVEVWAVAGRALSAATWTDLSDGPIRYGVTTTVRLGTAPFPDSGASWTDDRVNVFVPDGFIDRGPVPFVVHFHGHNTTLASTLPAHRYREQLWASGVDAVLVTPQGPVSAASGNFGKLMDAGGLEALLTDVVELLYRDGHVTTPQAGDLVLTEHSGGYQAVALNLDAQTDGGQVLAAHLFDGLYGYVSSYESFARAGGYLRSNYTSGGGTRGNNRDLAETLGALAVEDSRAETLLSAPAAIWFTRASHNNATWWEQAYAETLRWGSTNARRGPRIELRTASVDNGTATVTWLAPDDDWTTGYLVQVSTNRLVWTTAAEVSAGRRAATFLTEAGGHYVRVVPVVEDLDQEVALPSDTYWMEASPVLVVDGFDRYLGGSWLDLRHDSAARVGRAAGAAAASNEAVLASEILLGDFAAVIWLVGDESVADHTFTAEEQALVSAYLDGGGRVIASGSEIAFDLRNNGASFLSELGAVYQADDANQLRARGAGPLATLQSFGFGGPGAPYAEDYPDVLGTASGATIVLQYENGMTAAAGRAGESVVVGFPLELIDDADRMAEVVEALLGFVGHTP